MLFGSHVVVPWEDDTSEWMMLYRDYEYAIVSVLGAVVVLAVIRFMLRSNRIRTAGVRASGDDGEARFRTLAEAIPQIVWTALPDSGVDYYNRRWYELTGLIEHCII